MYTALYRAYRPEVFEELLGQDHIARILKNQIASGNTSHAYLFCGTRGTGKTTTARLLAKGLNCLSDGERPCGECEACRAIRDGRFLDVVEIDAASNRSIDDIRELRDSVNYPPAEGRNKVYIIDEVHMLTTEAFNALLKTLEEPPEYVTFILATTEPRKLPATILSRCLRLDFKRIPEPVLIQGMKRICGEIGIEVTEPALRIIAANADGSVRDGLSILDQCVSGGDRTVDVPQVLDLLGSSGEAAFVELTDLVSRRRTAEAIEYLADVLADGKDVRQLIRDWINHYRNLMMTKFIRDPQALINLSVENIDRIRQQSSLMELEDITRGIMELSKTADAARWSSQPRILLEVCIVNLCQGSGSIPSQVMQEKPARKTSVPRTSAQPDRSQSLQKQASAPKQSSETAPENNPAAPEKNPEAHAAEPAEEIVPLEESVEEADGTLSALDKMIAQAKASAGPAEPAEKAPKKSEPAPKKSEAAPKKSELVQEKAESAPEKSEPVQEKAEAVPEKSEPAPSPEQDEEFDLGRLWDEVFADGEHARGSIYLIRKGGMLTSMDGSSFTVTVNTDLIRRQTERNRDLLEQLMEARTGQHRFMRVEINDRPGGEPSAEEAAARASEVLGVEVGIE